MASAIGAAVLLSLVAATAGVSLRGPVNSTVDVEALRSQVLGSNVVRSKIAQMCSNQNQDCEQKASYALFCQLLHRSKPELVAPACGGETGLLQQPSTMLAAMKVKAPLAKGTLAAIKAKVMAGESFKHDAASMAVALGCNGVKKTANCDEYVQEAAFCFAFAQKLDKFKGMPGADEEKAYCSTIDKQMPALSMLLQGQNKPMFMQISSKNQRSGAPEDDLAQEMTHDLEMNFNKIAPFGKEDTAKELQDHAAKTQDTLVDAVENAEVAEIKRAVFRALTRLRAATIKEFDTIARLETQAIDAYNDAHHYRAENPLSHLHEDEAPVETDKLKSFH